MPSLGRIVPYGIHAMKRSNDVTSLSLGVNEFKSQIRHEKDTYPKLQFHCKLALVKRVVVDKSVVGNASD